MFVRFKIYTKSFLPLIFFILLFACNRTAPKKNIPVKYLAYLNADTAIATIEASKALFKGVLEIRYKNGYKDSGNVKGFVKGRYAYGRISFSKILVPGVEEKPNYIFKKRRSVDHGQGNCKVHYGNPSLRQSLSNRLYRTEQLYLYSTEIIVSVILD